MTAYFPIRMRAQSQKAMLHDFRVARAIITRVQLAPPNVVNAPADPLLSELRLRTV